MLAALASFIIPGLGQLVQARMLPAFLYFSIELGIWYVISDAFFMLLGLKSGWGSPWCLLPPLISHIAAAHDCATFKHKRPS